MKNIKNTIDDAAFRVRDDDTPQISMDRNLNRLRLPMEEVKNIVLSVYYPIMIIIT